VLYNRDSTIQKCFRKSTLCTSQKNWFPVSRPDAHMSTIPSVLTTCHTVRTPDRPSIIRPDPSLYRETSVPACIRPDDSASRPDALQYSIKLPILSKIIWEDCCNRPDDVDFRPDALLLKVRIVIQIQPSGRLSAWSGRAFNRYVNCGFNFNPSGRLPFMVRTRTQ
jgi:hypothetical protein